MFCKTYTLSDISYLQNILKIAYPGTKVAWCKIVLAFSSRISNGVLAGNLL